MVAKRVTLLKRSAQIGDFVHKAIEHIGFGTFQWLVLALLYAKIFRIAPVATIQATIEPFLRCQMKLSNLQASFIVTTDILAGGISTILIGKLSDSFGRRRVMLLFFILHSFFSLISTLSSSFIIIVITRAAAGAAIPVRAAILSYTFEVLPASKRNIISWGKVFNTL